MTRVVQLTSVHPWNDIRIFRKMARSVAAAGFDTHIVAVDRDSEANQELVVDGVRVHRLAGKDILGRRQRFWVGGRRAAAYAATLKPDILHVHDPELVPLVAARRWPGRVIFDSHESLPDQIFAKNWIPKALKPPFRTFAQMLEAVATKRFDGIIGATPAIASRFPKHKAQTIQNYPISGEFARWNDLSGAADWSNRPQAGIYVGAISRARGILPLVAGLAKASRLDRLVLVGSFENVGLFEQAKATSGWEKVDYRGQLPREQLAELMSSVRFGAVTFLPYPNHVEAQPNKMFEYLSAGLPVLASDFPLWRDIMGEDVAAYVEPNDPESIGRAIDAILSPSDAAQADRSRQAAASIAGKLNWEAESERLIAYYRRLLG